MSCYLNPAISSYCFLYKDSLPAGVKDFILSITELKNLVEPALFKVVTAATILSTNPFIPPKRSIKLSTNPNNPDKVSVNPIKNLSSITSL